MYRLRTADKGRPLIISDAVISEYADCFVDTLHKKNLLALGEDRYLTTLMTKHFPAMSYKFIPDAYAQTAAPESWSVLLSQRRRWINSTIHNLAELVFLKDLCGFCCFSMRFVVFIDLFGTVILPATCCYLGYLIYRVATHSGQFPLISIIMIAAVYGLQAVIFIIKRQWQHIGWMIIYILAFPIYSFVLPIYSFWNQDNFTWGSTRIVIGEKGNKQIVALEDEGFDPRSIRLQRWDDYALENNLRGRRGNAGNPSEKYQGYTDDPGMEMDDIHSTYSSVKPASTVLSGFPQAQQGHQTGPYMAPPYSPTVAAFNSGLNANRQSTMTSLAAYHDQPTSLHGQQMSIGNGSACSHTNSPYQSGVVVNGFPFSASRPSLLGMPSNDSNPFSHTATPYRNSTATAGGRPVSSVIDFRTPANAGPDDTAIVEAIRACLAEVDLDSVTKKQVRALVEQRLQTELVGDRKVFLDRAIDNELANM
jgi:chitin synthase